jgi:hypothetical protein
MNFTRKSSQETKTRSEGRRLLKCGEIQQERETTEKEMIEAGGGDSGKRASILLTPTSVLMDGTFSKWLGFLDELQRNFTPGFGWGVSRL